MTLKVIGAGFGRTGTLALKTALETLGLDPCQHWVELNRHPELFDRWIDAIDNLREGNPVDWESVFPGYSASVDWPTCSLVGELKRVYPDAKIILTVRDPDSWYESVSETLYALHRITPDWICIFIPRLRKIRYLSNEVIWGPNGVFGGRFEDREHSIAVFKRHNQKIIETFEPDDVLVLDIAGEYEALCEFLNRPVPAQPFPRLNERARIKYIVRLLRFGPAILSISLIAGLVYWML